jgi:hypothetical protein
MLASDAGPRLRWRWSRAPAGAGLPYQPLLPFPFEISQYLQVASRIKRTFLTNSTRPKAPRSQAKNWPGLSDA